MIKSYLKKIIKFFLDSNYINHKADKKEEAMKIIMPPLKSWQLFNGDYLEFGVYKGRAFLQAYKYANYYKYNQMKFYAFDSFEGLPVVKGKDAEYKHFTKGQFACSKDEFCQILNKAEVNMDRVEIIPGFFDKILTSELKIKLNIQRASIVWIDCDLYESTVPVLNFITDFITTGTFIVFDDWFSFGGDPFAGQIRATREWLEKNKNITLEHYRDFGTSGKIFLVQKWN